LSVQGSLALSDEEKGWPSHTYQLRGEEAEKCPDEFAEGLAGPTETVPGPPAAGFLPRGEGADEVPWSLVAGRDVEVDG
jgi:hypothetical protein